MNNTYRITVKELPGFITVKAPSEEAALAAIKMMEFTAKNIIAVPAMPLKENRTNEYMEFLTGKNK